MYCKAKSLALVISQDQLSSLSLDTPTPLDLSLIEAENQRTTKRPWMLGHKATRGVDAIKKIRKHELHNLEAMVWVPFILGPWSTPT